MHLCIVPGLLAVLCALTISGCLPLSGRLSLSSVAGVSSTPAGAHYEAVTVTVAHASVPVPPARAWPRPGPT